MNQAYEAQTKPVLRLTVHSARSFYPVSVVAQDQKMQRIAIGSNELASDAYAVPSVRQIALLHRDYVLINASGIVEFLTYHRAIPELLFEAVPQLRAAFGLDPVLTVEMVGEEEQSSSLVVKVRWSDSLLTARQALASFDEHWWLNVSDKASGALVFDYHLV